MKKQRKYFDSQLGNLRRNIGAMEDGLLKINEKKEQFLKDFYSEF